MFRFIANFGEVNIQDRKVTGRALCLHCPCANCGVKVFRPRSLLEIAGSHCVTGNVSVAIQNTIKFVCFNVQSAWLMVIYLHVCTVNDGVPSKVLNSGFTSVLWAIIEQSCFNTNFSSTVVVYETLTASSSDSRGFYLLNLSALDVR